MKIKVCVDARMIHSSGIGTYIQNLLPFFSKDPFDLICLVKKKGDTKYQEIVFNYPIYSIREQIAFPLKIPKCDLFWSPHYNSPFLPIRARKRVVTIHDVCHLALPDLLHPIKRLYAKILLKISSLTSSKIITVSFFSKNEISKFLDVSKNKIEVIYSGVNRNLFKVTDSASIREKYGIKGRYFLFVGNLKKHKNVDGLINAFKLFREKNGELFGLVLVGKYQEFDRLAANSLNVKVLGEVPLSELPAIYSGAEALVFPSFYEGFGLPPLEAMACRTPVIASNISSIPEICGEGACYVSPYSSEQMAEAMNRIIYDCPFKSKLVKLGAERELHFSWENSGNIHRAIFLKLLGI